MQQALQVLYSNFNKARVLTLNISLQNIECMHAVSSPHIEPYIGRCLNSIRYSEGGEKKSFTLKERVATKWRVIGLLLDMETSQLERIEEEVKGSDIERWVRVMEWWLKGKGSDQYPVGWDGLYDLLIDVSEEAVADEMRRAITMANT